MGTSLTTLATGIISTLAAVALAVKLSNKDAPDLLWLPFGILTAGAIFSWIWHALNYKKTKEDLEKLTTKIENYRVLAKGEDLDAKGVAVSAAAAKKAIEAFDVGDREKLIKTISNTAADAKNDELSDKFLEKLGETVNDPPKEFSVFTRLKAATTPS
jgi:hypothetical protein